MQLEKQIQQLQYDTKKTNERVTGITEKLEDNTNGIKKIYPHK